MKNLRTIFATVVAGTLAFSLSACGEAPKATPKEDKTPVVTEITLKNVASACDLHISNNNGMKEIAMGMDSGNIGVEKSVFYKKASCVASIMAPDGVDYRKAMKTVKSREDSQNADHSLYFTKDGYEFHLYAMGAKVNGGTARRMFELYTAKDRKAYFERVNKELDNTLKSLNEAGDGSDHNDTND